MDYSDDEPDTYIPIHYGKNKEYPIHRGHPDLIDFNSNCLILGKTRTGKSSYLKILVDEIMEDNSVVIIDPHGGVAHWSLFCGNDTGDATILTLSGSDYPESKGIYTGFNALSYQKGNIAEANRVSSWLREALYGLSSDRYNRHSNWGQRLETIFSAILTGCMLREPGINLLKFSRVLSDPDILLSYFPELSNPIEREYLKAYSGSRKSWFDFIASSLNRLLPLVTNPLIRRIISCNDDQAVDLDDYLLNKQTLLVPDLNRSFLGNDAVRVISTLLLTRIWNVLTRHGERSKKICIVIDEAQLIPSEILETFLSEGGKYGLVTILAMQSLKQVPESVASTILSNTRNFACFALSYDDANLMARNMVGDPDDWRELVDVLISQPAQYSTVYSASGDYVYGPNTVMIPTCLIDSSSFQSDVSNIKARIAMETGYTEKEFKFEERKIDPHSQMITQFSAWLERHGIRTRIEPNIGRSYIPDIVLDMGDHRLYCEVEISDLKFVFNIAKKLKQYQKEYLIFLCDAKDFDTLIAIFKTLLSLKPDDYIHRDMEKIGIADIFPRILKTHIIVRKDEKFFYYNGFRLVRLGTAYIFSEGSLMARVSKLSLGTIRKRIFDDLVVYLTLAGSFNFESVLENQQDGERMIKDVQARGYREVDLISLTEIDRITSNLS